MPTSPFCCVAFVLLPDIVISVRRHIDPLSNLTDPIEAEQSNHSLVLSSMQLSSSGSPRSPWFFCWTASTCKCQSGPQESSARCIPGTCAYSGIIPPCRRHALCSEPTSWAQCQWVNPGGSVPEITNESLFTEVPRKPDVDWSQITGVTVYTDMDDTLTCSGGGMAGVDSECEGTHKKGLYPGVAAFQLALTLGPHGNFAKRRVIPVSARPVELKWFLRIKAGSHLDTCFQQVANDSTWGFDVDRALYGSVLNGTDFLRYHPITPYKKMAYRKYRSWSSHGVFDPATIGIWVGDNGQGDFVAAQMMLKASSNMTDGAIRAAFIHDVRRLCKDQLCRKRWAEHGIYFFRNYAEALDIAKEAGFVHADATVGGVYTKC
eukprot:TRINITY_DN68562_c0_g1_i1.p1 TRINITY_DN68562_c0_g1~~TRINITY_DN68562_c0_g1_i1.p1  ORF type:complete len:376 (-),score=33.79 TRINITY_DN68562_c0_g1_i1:100-1227(-)